MRLRYGYQRIHMLLRREGRLINHKRAYRLYKEGLNLRREARAQPTRLSECWSMDYMSDALFNGRRLRVLTVLDILSCESLAIQAGKSIRGEDVVANGIVTERGLPDWQRHAVIMHIDCH